jgi:hypothetical protein
MREFFKENGIKKTGQRDQKTGKEIWLNGKKVKTLNIIPLMNGKARWSADEKRDKNNNPLFICNIIRS